MTVPPLFGWEVILTVLVLLVALAVAFFLASAAGTAADDRSDWEAWLDARSTRRRPTTGADASDQGRAPNDGRPVSSGRTR
jgi:hypothetical protein